MDNLELLSDDDLKRRLLQYGFPNLPITSTTRRVLIKKLRNYMNTEATKLRRDTSYATRYSSDEEMSDKESTNKRFTIPTLPKHQFLNKRTNVYSLSAKNELQADGNKKVSIQPKKSIYLPPPVHYDHDNFSTNMNNFASNRCLNETRFAQQISVPVLNSKIPESDLNLYDNGRISTDSSSLNNGKSSNDSPYISTYTKRLLNLRGATVSDSSKNEFYYLIKKLNTSVKTNNF